MNSRVILFLYIIISSCSQSVTQKPEDFESFWNSSLKELDGSDVFKEVKDSLVNNKMWKQYMLKSFNNVSFSMWVSEPLEKEKFPIKVNFLDFKSNRGKLNNNLKFLEEEKVINVIVDVKEDTLNTVESINNNLITNGLKSRDSYIFKYTFLNAVKAIDFLAKHPKSNGSIITIGTGFGGTLAIVTSALNSKVTACSVVSPFLTDISNNDKKEWPMNIFVHYCNREGKDYFDLMDTLSYFDVLSFSNKINIPILIRSQEIDARSPVEGVLKFYSQVKNSEKLIYIAPCKEFRCVTYSSFSRELEKTFLQKYLLKRSLN